MPQPPNINKMLQQAQEMMAAQQQAQESLKEERVEASAGGGMVKVVASGDLRIQSIAIDPDAVDPEDVEMLQDLVTAAVNEALRQVEELASSKLGGGMGDMDPASMLDALGGLGGLGGGLPGGGGRGPAPGAPNRAARRAQKKR
jgi:DNA-binding YbaB/EbfC family protein